MTFIDRARPYLAWAWPLVPLHWPTPAGCSCRNPDCGSSTGKHPLTKNGLHDASVDPSTVHAWAKRYPDANIGCRSGLWPHTPGNGLYVIDIDGPAGLASVDGLAHDGRVFTPTATASTGHGRHLYYSTTIDLPNTAGKIAPRIDTRGRGGLIVVPPSRHSSGRRYEWIVAPHDLAPQPLPVWIIQAVTATKRTTMAARSHLLPNASRAAAPDHRFPAGFPAHRIAPLLAALRSAPEGQRNHTLNRSAWIAFKVARETNSDDGFLIALFTDTARASGLTDAEITRTIASAYAAALV